MENENVTVRASLLDNIESEDRNIQVDDREDRRHRGEYTYEEAISSVGYGKFHYKLLALCGWALSSDAIEVLAISFILPPATCDLGLSNSDKGLLNSSVFLGMMIGGYIWGTLADIYGRRYVLLWSLTVNGIGGLSSSLSQSFPVFILLRFISGIGVGGSLPVIFAYYTEFQPKEKRGSMISLLATFWMCGNIVAAGVAWIIIPRHIGVVSGDFIYNSWRIYLSICTLPSISSAMFFLLMPESPKYLMTELSSHKAIMVLRRIFRSNCPDRNIERDFPVEELYSDTKESFGNSVDDINIRSSNGWMQIKGACAKFVNATKELFKAPLTSVSVIMVLIYFTLSFGYYGMFLWFPELFNRIEKYGGSPCSLGSANSTTFNGTEECVYDASSKIYYESFLTAASNLPGNIFTILMIDKIGRKIMLAGSMVISGCSVFFIALLHNTTESLIMSCVFSAISVMGWNALDVLQMELYPTKLRSTASGVLMSVGRIASILGNLAFGELVDVYCLVPMFMVASLLTVGGLLSLKLPNTIEADLQ